MFSVLYNVFFRKLTLGSKVKEDSREEGKQGSKNCEKCGKFIKTSHHYCCYCGQKQQDSPGLDQLAEDTKDVTIK